MALVTLIYHVRMLKNNSYYLKHHNNFINKIFYNKEEEYNLKIKDEGGSYMHEHVSPNCTYFSHFAVSQEKPGHGLALRSLKFFWEAAWI